MWLMGDEEYAAWRSIETNVPYCHYGKERLIAVCERYGLDWRAWDNGESVD
jgi:hypothetical protein